MPCSAVQPGAAWIKSLAARGGQIICENTWQGRAGAEQGGILRGWEQLSRAEKMAPQSKAQQSLAKQSIDTGRAKQSIDRGRAKQNRGSGRAKHCRT